MLTGCASNSTFDVTSIAKTDVDEISEIHLDRVTGLVESLTRKLYKRNPVQLKKQPGHTVESRLEMILECPPLQAWPEIDYKTGTDAILLGLEPAFEGDRVFAVMYGMYTMILSSYNDKCQFYIFDSLDQQHLYNSARNIEILVWRLKTRLADDDDTPLLLTDSAQGPVPNLSFERIFGQLISLQDTMAVIVAGRTNRMIKEVVHWAGMTFLPVGF